LLVNTAKWPLDAAKQVLNVAKWMLNAPKSLLNVAKSIPSIAQSILPFARRRSRRTCRDAGNLARRRRRPETPLGMASILLFYRP
jgi:hypothetical protein